MSEQTRVVAVWALAAVVVVTAVVSRSWLSLVGATFAVALAVFVTVSSNRSS